MTRKAVIRSRTGEQLDADAVYGAIALAGINPGDTVMVHSRLFTIGRVISGVSKKDVVDAFLSALLRAVGEKGTLIFPTFTLSVCRGGHFDLQNTPSEMGLLSEHARLMAGVVRTPHPFYSSVVLGGSKDFLSGLDLSTSFGTGSIFDRLHAVNRTDAQLGRVKFLTLGIDCPPEGITYIHSIEEKLQVPYRYHKSFSGKISDRGTRADYAVDFFVRRRDVEVDFDGDSCWSLLKQHRKIGVEPLGDSIVCVAPELALFSALTSAISQESDFLCRGGYEPNRLE